VIKEEDKILLSLRQGTKYADGMWSMIAGHAEVGESAKQAIVRESKEEAGINISLSDLETIYVMDRRTDERQNIDIFFNCKEYSGRLINLESHKCGGLEFFNINVLPINIVPYIKKAIEDMDKKIIYREFEYY
jgi:8-oxo-dGTP pyrophosphatase MutT (NUDIX family)